MKTTNLVELRRSWTRVRDCTVHQTNSLDALVMLELLDRLELSEQTVREIREFSEEWAAIHDKEWMGEAQDFIRELLERFYPATTGA